MHAILLQKIYCQCHLALLQVVFKCMRATILQVLVRPHGGEADEGENHGELLHKTAKASGRAAHGKSHEQGPAVSASQRTL